MKGHRHRANKKEQVCTNMHLEGSDFCAGCKCSINSCARPRNMGDFCYGHGKALAKLPWHFRAIRAAQKAYEQQKQDQDGNGTVKDLATVVRLPSASGRGWVWSGEAAQEAVAQILAWREEVLQGLGGTAGPSGPGVTAGPGAPGVILSFEQQKAIHKKRIAWWKMRPRTRRISMR